MLVTVRRARRRCLTHPVTLRSSGTPLLPLIRMPPPESFSRCVTRVAEPIRILHRAWTSSTVTSPRSRCTSRSWCLEQTQPSTRRKILRTLPRRGAGRRPFRVSGVRRRPAVDSSRADLPQLRRREPRPLPPVRVLRDQPRAGGGPQEVRKTVTVVFSDLKGSTTSASSSTQSRSARS